MTTPSGRIPPGPDDDDDEWMDIFRSLPDAEVDDLLAGRPPASPAAASLIAVFGVLRAHEHRYGAPPMSDALRRQIARPTPVVPSPQRRRRVLLGGLLGVVLGGSGLGAAGAQNALPAPLQDAAASAAGVLGIDLPRAADRDADHDQAPVDPDDEETDPGEPGTDPGPDPTGPRGPPETTPGGAVPADPGTPGDHEPATPATPATGNGQGNGDGQGNPNPNGNSAPETGQANGPGTAPP